MTGNEAVQKLLKEDINSLNFEIPADVFQFTLNRNDAFKYLDAHREVPFILRRSSKAGYFAMDIPARDRQSIGSTLVSQSKVNEKEFQWGILNNDVYTEIGSLKEYVKKYWDPEQKCILSDSELAARKDEIWEQFKQLQQQQFEQRRRQEDAQRRLRERTEAQDKMLEGMHASNPCLLATPVFGEKTYNQNDYDLFMASPQQPSPQHGIGFFQGQAAQQSVQQRSYPSPLQTHHTQSEFMNKGF